MSRVVEADTAMVASYLGITPGYVRLLVGKGVLTPIRPGSRGRGNSSVFDLRACAEAFKRYRGEVPARPI